MVDIEHTPKSSRLLKKTAIQVEKDKTSKSLTSLAVRGIYSKESTPVGSLSRLDEGAYEQTHYAQGGMAEETTNGRKMSYHHDDQHYNNMNYYRNYNESMTQQHHHDVARNHMLTEGLEHHGNYPVQYSRDYESYNDMVSHLHQRGAHAAHGDEYFTDPSAAFLHQRELNAHHQMEHGADYHEHHDGGFNPLKSFMDTQTMFRDALKKATHVSYSNSNGAGFRKSSIDLF